MIYASDFRKGITFEMNGEPHVVLDFQHVKPGKGAAFVRTKYRNILTGATREEAFNPNDKFPKAHIETKQMQYLSMTENSTTSWIRRLTIRFLLHMNLLRMPSSISARMTSLQ